MWCSNSQSPVFLREASGDFVSCSRCGTNTQSDVVEVSPPPRPTPEVVSLLDECDEDVKPRIPAADGPEAARRLGRDVCVRIVRA